MVSVSTLFSSVFLCAIVLFGILLVTQMANRDFSRKLIIVKRSSQNQKSTRSFFLFFISTSEIYYQGIAFTLAHIVIITIIITISIF